MTAGFAFDRERKEWVDPDGNVLDPTTLEDDGPSAEWEARWKGEDASMTQPLRWDRVNDRDGGHHFRATYGSRTFTIWPPDAAAPDWRLYAGQSLFHAISLADAKAQAEERASL